MYSIHRLALQFCVLLPCCICHTCPHSVTWAWQLVSQVDSVTTVWTAQSCSQYSIKCGVSQMSFFLFFKHKRNRQFIATPFTGWPSGVPGQVLVRQGWCEGDGQFEQHWAPYHGEWSKLATSLHHLQLHHLGNPNNIKHRDLGTFADRPSPWWHPGPSRYDETPDPFPALGAGWEVWGQSSKQWGGRRWCRQWGGSTTWVQE